MPLIIGLKRRASRGDTQPNGLKKKKSRIFGRVSTSAPVTPTPLSLPPPTLQPSTLSKLRRRSSQILIKMHVYKAPVAQQSMDGAASPHHRIISTPAPALTPASKVGKVRALFTSSSSREQPQAPQRKRSVRFEGLGAGQLDGPPREDSGATPTQTTKESRRSSVSQRFSDQMDNLSDKIIGTNGTQTIVHRTKIREKSAVPFMSTKADPSSGRTAEDGNASPSTTSSFTSLAHNADWSPASTASTAASSWASPRSSGPASRNRHTPEDCQNRSKSVSAGVDEGFLPPIQENSGRLLMIPVQEAPVEAEPSIVTVERTAAAKVYFETHFHTLLMEPSSSRSIRRKKFEQRMTDLGFSHDERENARHEWNRTESDHLRQKRVLNASSIARHQVKGISIAGFDVIRVLGKGSFGVVRLVTERSGIVQAAQNGHESYASNSPSKTAVSNIGGMAKRNLPAGKPLSDVFAMKVIRKSDMLRACQEGHLRAERDFLVGAEGSRWVVPLIASFQDNSNLYLVMEYMIGGDFLGLLLREDVLDEEVAR